MTALAAPRSRTRTLSDAPGVRTLILVAALAIIVGGRWAAWRTSAVDPVLLGALFGTGLLAAAMAGRWRPRRLPGVRQGVRSAALGVAVGLLIAGTALVGPHPSWAPILAASFPFWPWATATALVAIAEEALLRGALFDTVSEAGGAAAALFVTSLAFALMHVPTYGWSAVPLDLSVGLILGGLRLASGGVTAPAVAHAIADLAVIAL